MTDEQDQQEVSTAKIIAVGMDWKLSGAECPNCKGEGRVGILACKQCGATGRLIATATNGAR